MIKKTPQPQKPFFPTTRTSKLTQVQKDYINSRGPDSWESNYQKNMIAEGYTISPDPIRLIGIKKS